MSVPIEHHPLRPFLPPNARLLMLGSFPPSTKRWAMQFFYPNMQNDMWRIFGSVFHSNPLYFINEEQKCFKQQLLTDFLSQKGVALFDTATSVRRLRGTASDKDLEVVEETNVIALLQQLPNCVAMAATGQKATQILCQQFGAQLPSLGQCCEIFVEELRRSLRFYRMPSSSRAYPMKLEEKSATYRRMFVDLGMIE